MLKQLLTLALVVLAFVAACTAQPTSVENVKRNNMKCNTFSNRIKVCKDSGSTQLYGMTMDKVNNIFYNGLPTGKYRSYEFCVKGACGSMSSISGTEFVPKNFQSVARRARQHWLDTINCVGDGSLGLDYFYSTAVDITMPNDNFAFSWWVNSLPSLTGKCNK